MDIAVGALGGAIERAVKRWMGWDMPELQRLVLAASLSPQQLELARRAFDDAWREIAGNYDGTSAVQLGRTRLATMILGVMGEAGIDETQIKEKALALMHQAEEPVPLDRARKRRGHD